MRMKKKYQSMTDKELVILTQQGNMDAYAIIYKRHFLRVFNFIYSKTENPDETQDITQSTFLQALRKINSLNDPGSFATWLTQIAYNWMRCEYRRKKNEAKRIQRLMRNNPSFANHLTPYRLAHSHQILERVKNLFSILPKQQRDGLYMSCILGLSKKERIAATQKNDNSTRSCIRRAREKARAYLHDLK